MTTRAVTVAINARDPNGYNDNSSVNVTVLKPDGVTILVETGIASFVSGTGANGEWNYIFNMNYYDSAVMGTTTYKVIVVVTDLQAASADNSASPAIFNYTELLALSLDSNLIDFGAADPAQTSNTFQVIGTNAGNVLTDVALSGTTLVNLSDSTKTIIISQVDYALSSAFDTPLA